jgi:hypothetical protein
LTELSAFVTALEARKAVIALVNIVLVQKKTVTVLWLFCQLAILFIRKSTFILASLLSK